MSNPLRRKCATVALLVAFAGGATALLPGAAVAKQRVLSGTHSFGSVAAACGGAGGDFHVATSGGYSCTTATGVVSCNAKGQCTGSCNAKTCPANVRGLNGILRPPASAGTTYAASRNVPNETNKPVGGPLINNPGTPKMGASRH